MCGIVAVASDRDVAARLIAGLRNLEYRGYDSCGVAVIGPGGIEVRKNVGSPEEVARSERFDEIAGVVGMGHTRWATHGGVTPGNSHPHLSCDRAFALVHNGIIRNHQALRQRLAAAGHRFASETDTEVAVHLIEEHFAALGSVEAAFVAAVRELEGSYALVMLTTHEPGRIYGARLRTPLLVGAGSDGNFIASDYTAFVEHTRRIVYLEDGEIAVLDRRDYRLQRLVDGAPVQRPAITVDWDVARSRKGGHAHFMLKEIHEQPQAIQAALDLDVEPIEELADSLLAARRAYLVGVGTTYYVALLASYYARRLAGVYLPAISSDEFAHLAECDHESCVLAFSQSGETFDTLSALRHAREAGTRTAAIVNVLGSSMVRAVDLAVLQGSGPEMCVLSTKAALAQVVVFLRVALAMARRRGVPAAELAAWESELAGLDGRVKRLLDEKQAFLRAVARRQAQRPNWLYLGRGIYYAVALEAALKMKEVTYQHAEGMQAGFLKHGTIALVDPAMVSVFFVPPETDRELHEATLGTLAEVKARNGFTVGFHFGQPAGAFDEEVVLPPAPPLTAPLLLVVAGQLLAYFSAVQLKRNVDRPRSLAKSVTVE